MTDAERFLDFLIQEGALRWGDFTLKSGARSPFFVDLGQVSTGAALATLGEWLAECIVQSFGTADVLYGPPYKAIPMVTCAAMALHRRVGTRVGICYARKETKEHGERGLLIGRIPIREDRVLVVDDVFTTGATKLHALEVLEEATGVRALGIVVAIDRRKKGQDTGLAGIPLVALATLGDMVNYLDGLGDSRAGVVRRFWED